MIRRFRRLRLMAVDEVEVCHSLRPLTIMAQR
jgi:hypothetical protein